ncbi:MAG: DNA polymerase III subunit chi [Pseudomonadota bacterium]|nr:DNA polymerase III subunit chi [Pseudomonadota bacterium]
MQNAILFYVLPTSSEQQLSELILALCQQGIHIQTNDQNHAHKISTLLWEYPEERFIPNMINCHCPLPVIHIGWGEIPNDRTFIINTSSQQLDKVNIEWVIGHKNSESLIQARERYAYWKQRGYHLQYHTQVT